MRGLAGYDLTHLCNATIGRPFYPQAPYTLATVALAAVALTLICALV